MSKLEKLDLMGVTSLAAVAAALLLGWIATTQSAAAQGLAPSRENPAVALTAEGRMKLVVVAARPEPVTLLANGRMKLTVSATPTQAVAAHATARRQS